MAFKESTPISSLPGGVDPGVELVAVGRWGKKGHVEIRVDGRRLPDLRMPANPWNVLALLIEAGCKSQGEHWAMAYLSPAALAAKLYKRAGLGGGEAANVHRTVNQLRQKLSQAAKEWLGVAGWGNVLIETDVTYGYCVRAAPQGMRITLLDDTSGTDEPAC